MFACTPLFSQRICRLASITMYKSQNAQKLHQISNTQSHSTKQHLVQNRPFFRKAETLFKTTINFILKIADFSIKTPQ